MTDIISNYNMAYVTNFKFEIPQASEALVITAPGYKSKEVPVVRPLKPVSVVLEK